MCSEVTTYSLVSSPLPAIIFNNFRGPEWDIPIDEWFVRLTQSWLFDTEIIYFGPRPLLYLNGGRRIQTADYQSRGDRPDVNTS